MYFKTKNGQDDYYKAYDKTLQMWDVEYSEIYIDTSFGKSHCAEWLNETLNKLDIKQFYLCGLSISGWNAAITGRGISVC